MSNRVDQDKLYQKDIYENFIKSGDEALRKATEINEVLKKEIKLMAQLAGSLGTTAKDINALNAARNRAKKALDEQQKMELSITRAREKLNKVTEKQRSELASLRVEEQRRNKEARTQALLTSNQVGAFEKLNIKIKQLADRYRDLIAQEGRETEQSRQLRMEILALNGVRDRANESLGMHQHRVGQYSQAIGKLTKFMGALGLSFGVFQLLRSSFSVLGDFDEKLADIAKTTGLTISAAKDLSLELLKIDTRTSVTALQELASAAGRLGITGVQNIIDFATSADKVFVALGDDLSGTADEIATELGKISSAFGLEEEFGIAGGIERVGSVINELAANSKAGASEILDFTNRMTGLASVAGISAQDIGALGALFDSTGQSIEVASTVLQKLLPEIAADQEHYAQVAGMTAESFKELVANSPIEALKAVAQGAESSETGLIGLVETLGDFGVDSARAASIVGVLSQNTEELTRLQDLANTAFEENTSVTDEFNIKNNTLNAGLEKLQKAWDTLLIEWNEGIGIGETLKNILSFLADNLETVVRVVIGGLRAWALQKLAISLFRNEVDETGKIIKFGLIPSIINSSKMLVASVRSFSAGTIGARGFGAALKSIPFVGIISGISTVVGLFWDNTEAADANTIAIGKNAQANEELNIQLIERAKYLRELNMLLTEGRSDVINLTTADLKELAEGYKDALKETEALVDIFKIQDKLLSGSEGSFEDYLEVLLRSTDLTNDGVNALHERRDALINLQKTEEELAKRGAGGAVRSGGGGGVSRTAIKTNVEYVPEDIPPIDVELKPFTDWDANQKIAVEDINDELEKELELQDEINLGLYEQKLTTEEIADLWTSIGESIESVNTLVNQFFENQLAGIELQKSAQQEIYDDAKSNEQYLRDVAREKGLNADESIKAERDAQRDAQAEIARLEEKRQKIEAFIAVLNAYANGKSVSDIKGDILSIKSFVEGAFYKGTDTVLGDELGYKSQRDGHLIAADSREAILSGDKVHALGIGKGKRSTSDIVDIVKMFDSGILGATAFSQISANDARQMMQGNETKQLADIANKLDSIANNTSQSNKPIERNTFDILTGTLEYVSTSKGRKQTRKYNIKK